MGDGKEGCFLLVRFLRTILFDMRKRKPQVVSELEFWLLVTVCSECATELPNDQL